MSFLSRRVALREAPGPRGDIFKHLSRMPPVHSEEEAALYERRLPFRTASSPGDPHPGLRSYPFLPQVCRRFKAIMDSPGARALLWDEVVIDFGHELVTAVHVPMRWSDAQPSEEEFQQAFAAARLDAHKMVDFISQRRGYLTSLVLVNSEGYWTEEGEFVNLANKHSYGLATLGLTLGMLKERLATLRILYCNDLFSMGSPLGVIASLNNLRELELEGLHCRLYREPVAELGRLTQLEALVMNATQRHGVFIFGLDTIPDTWAGLGRLTRLELRRAPRREQRGEGVQRSRRGNALLEALPSWLPGAMPHLAALDVSFCSRLDLASVTTLTQAAQGGPPRVKLLPSLRHMAQLTAINLSDNNLVRVPPELCKMTALEYLDLNGCPWLQAKQPLTPLLGLTRLRYLDLRAIHVEDGKFWSADKCATMQHVAILARSLRRRRRQALVLHDTK
eukprot:scaffold4.g4746.t1